VRARGAVSGEGQQPSGTIAPRAGTGSAPPKRSGGAALSRNRRRPPHLRGHGTSLIAEDRRQRPDVRHILRGDRIHRATIQQSVDGGQIQQVFVTRLLLAVPVHRVRGRIKCPPTLDTHGDKEAVDLSRVGGRDDRFNVAGRPSEAEQPLVGGGCLVLGLQEVRLDYGPGPRV
jgi:hypothetical protein